MSRFLEIVIFVAISYGMSYLSVCNRFRDTCRTVCAVALHRKTNSNTNPNRYRRHYPDPNARIQKFIHYMATTPQWVVLQNSMRIAYYPRFRTPYINSWYQLLWADAPARAVRVELFTARVLYRVSYRVLDNSNTHLYRM